MGRANLPPPVMLMMAAFSRHQDLLARARREAEARFGPILATGPEYEFEQTRYYEKDMGAGLRKQLWAFGDLVAIDALPDIKHWSNALEAAIAAEGGRDEVRPINLDPGYLTLAKFVLATTKDNAHRLYLRDGIFAEVTLHYHAGSFEARPWTYADYRLPHTLGFLNETRELYRHRLAERAPS